MAVITLPPSPSPGSYTHQAVREKINEIIGQSNNNESNITPLQASVSALLAKDADSVVIVKSPSDLSGALDSTKAYFIDGVIDFTGTGLNIEVPAGGLSLFGFDFDVSQILCSDNSYTLFTSPVGGCGNLKISRMSLGVTGSGSNVHTLTSLSGFEAVELGAVNYVNCTSRGELTGFRQVFETGCGFIGGTPELTLSGTMSGVKTASTIALNMSNFTALYKTGTALSFTGRFATDIKCDLPAVGAFADFYPSNFAADELFEIASASITRQGVADATSTTVIPNITSSSVKSKWSNSSGVEGTQKYLRAAVTTEVTTNLAVIDTYYPLLGTFTVDDSSHISMPANGEFELLTGYDALNIFADIELDGVAGEVIDVRVTKSTDGGATYPTQVNHMKRVIANFSGPSDDRASFTIAFLERFAKGDRFRFEAENTTTGGSAVTMLIDSYVAVSK